MKITLIKVLTILALLFSVETIAQNTVSPDDLTVLIGEWTGTLTYMDYSSNQPYTMPANLVVEEGKNESQLLLFFNYPNEPNANSKDKIRISKNGTELNGNEVTLVQKLSDGKDQITTEYSGKDNNKKALIRNVYVLSKNIFVIKKEVKFENSEDWLIRNEYKFVR